MQQIRNPWLDLDSEDNNNYWKYWKFWTALIWIEIMNGLCECTCIFWNCFLFFCNSFPILPHKESNFEIWVTKQNYQNWLTYVEKGQIQTVLIKFFIIFFNHFLLNHYANIHINSEHANFRSSIQWPSPSLFFCNIKNQYIM